MKHFYKKAGCILCVVFFCSSCATIFNGTKQRISIDSKPRGATVKIHDQVIGTTPLSVKQPTKKPLSIVFSLQGYEDRMYVLDHKYEWRWLLLDVPFTFPYVNVPFAIDVISQSPYRFVQKEVMMDFDSVYSQKNAIVLDASEVRKRMLLDQQILQTQREMDALERQERIIFAEEERKRKLKRREEAIRLQQIHDSLEKERIRQSYTSSRAHNYSNIVRFKNSVTMELSSLIVGESRLEYHRNVYKGISLGIELGYKPAYYSRHTYTNKRDWQNSGATKEIMAMPFSESYYLGLATKIPIYKLGRGQYYFSMVSFIRNSFYDHAFISWTERNSHTYDAMTFKDSLSVDQNTYGLKVLLGFRRIIVFEKMGLEFDAYAGFSCRQITTEMFHYEMSKGLSYSSQPPAVIKNEAEKSSIFIPTVQAGVKVGIRF